MENLNRGGEKQKTRQSENERQQSEVVWLDALGRERTGVLPTRLTNDFYDEYDVFDTIVNGNEIFQVDTTPGAARFLNLATAFPWGTPIKMSQFTNFIWGRERDRVFNTKLSGLKTKVFKDYGTILRWTATTFEGETAYLFGLRQPIEESITPAPYIPEIRPRTRSLEPLITSPRTPTKAVQIPTQVPLVEVQRIAIDAEIQFTKDDHENALISLLLAATKPDQELTAKATQRILNTMGYKGKIVPTLAFMFLDASISRLLVDEYDSLTGNRKKIRDLYEQCALEFGWETREDFRTWISSIVIPDRSLGATMGRDSEGSGSTKIPYPERSPAAHRKVLAAIPTYPFETAASFDVRDFTIWALTNLDIYKINREHAVTLQDGRELSLFSLAKRAWEGKYGILSIKRGENIIYPNRTQLVELLLRDMLGGKSLIMQQKIEIRNFIRAVDRTLR